MHYCIDPAGCKPIVPKSQFTTLNRLNGQTIWNHGGQTPGSLRSFVQFAIANYLTLGAYAKRHLLSRCSSPDEFCDCWDCVNHHLPEKLLRVSAVRQAREYINKWLPVVLTDEPYFGGKLQDLDVNDFICVHNRSTPTCVKISWYTRYRYWSTRSRCQGHPWLFVLSMMKNWKFKDAADLAGLTAFRN